jgi:hypothetical protein
VSFGVAAHAAGIAEVNGNAAADAIKARLFNMPGPPVSWCSSENTLNRHSPDGQPIWSSDRPLKHAATASGGFVRNCPASATPVASSLKRARLVTSASGLYWPPRPGRPPNRRRLPPRQLPTHPADQATRTLTDAVVVFEVLSDDSATTDRVVKLIDHAAVPSLRG